MLKAVKSYWAFTNDLYKLVMLLVLPIVLIVVNMYLVRKGHGDGLMTLYVLFFVDTMSDFFFMNGFYRKNNSALEFLQSSTKFSRVVKEITIVDIIRRLLIYQIPIVIELIAAVGSQEKLEWCKNNAFWPWLASLIAQLVLLVTRHFVMWNHIYACTSIGYAVLLLSFLFISIVCSAWPVVTNVVLIVLILITSIATIRYTDKKVRESYYDE